MEKIIVYTSSTCPHCRTAKEYLKSKNYDYIEKNVQVDRQAAQELQQMGARGVPSFKIGDQLIIGFNPQAVEKAIRTKLIKCKKCNKKLTVPRDKGKIRVTCPHCSHKFIEES